MATPPPVNGWRWKTREVFAPLANRLGLWQLKWELEDLAFRFLQPEDYRRIAAALREKRVDRQRYITELCHNLEVMLRAAGVGPKSTVARNTSTASIGRWSASTSPLRRCSTCGPCASSPTPSPTVMPRSDWCTDDSPTSRAKFDDYIATPKDNFYRSIHTAVLGPEGKAVEVQIRTREMHESAELGMAAHWKYKEGRHKESRALDVSYDRKIEWVRKLLGATERGEEQSQRDFLDEVRSELFEDRVYALTPKGEVVDLPPGATPLDFAYHVHTDLGHRCRGARVNGRIVPLTRALGQRRGGRDPHA
jgi:GTP pyrophosphokinase